MTISRNRIGQIALMVPGLATCLVACGVDVARGGKLSDWGTGQSVLLAAGVALVVSGVLLHRKALKDAKAGRRTYPRTVVFVVAPMLILIVLPLVLAEVAARLIPEPDDSNTSYRQTDQRFGFSVAPDRQYHVVSQPKAFDIHIRIDSNGFRQGPDQRVVAVNQANVVIVGDSHPFGFGIAESNTLAAQLSDSLRREQLPDDVLNAGVPGFGPGQSLLRIESLADLRPGSLVVLFINPMNDLVNLSSAVDYHYPKPHPVLDDGALKFLPAPESWGAGAFLFSPPFRSLNSFFRLGDRRRWYHSALLRRLQNRSAQPPVRDGVIELIDSTSVEQFLAEDADRISTDRWLYASRFWPEMPQFRSEREELRKLATAVLRQTVSVCEARRWHFTIVVAPEAYDHQDYSRHFMQQVQQAVPEAVIEFGWSRNAILGITEQLSIPTIAPAYDDEDPEAFFVQNDDHTSAIGHERIANRLVEQIVTKNWLGSDAAERRHDPPESPRSAERDSP